MLPETVAPVLEIPPETEPIDTSYLSAITVKSRVFYKTLLGAIASVKVKLPKGCSITPQGVFHYTHRYG